MNVENCQDVRMRMEGGVDFIKKIHEKSSKTEQFLFHFTISHSYSNCPWEWQNNSTKVCAVSL